MHVHVQKHATPTRPPACDRKQEHRATCHHARAHADTSRYVCGYHLGSTGMDSRTQARLCYSYPSRGHAQTLPAVSQQSRVKCTARHFYVSYTPYLLEFASCFASVVFLPRYSRRLNPLFKLDQAVLGLRFSKVRATLSVGRAGFGEASKITFAEHFARKL
eukprot:6212346-Pleurochrysis_carterae.AAC.1